MLSKSIVNVFRCLLAAWMLLATSITSSIYAHSHDCGYVAHQHVGCDHRTHDSNFLHDEHGGYSSVSAAKTHHHGFLFLPGIAACLPSSEHERTSLPGDKSPCSWCVWVGVVSTAKCADISPQKELKIVRPAADYSSTALRECLCISKQQTSYCTGAVFVLPLCDRARHERSGVLLA